MIEETEIVDYREDYLSALRGHAKLKNDPMDAGRHRCELGMGIESKWRGQGFGHALLSRVAALAQAAKHL